jgi:hypothetical protein
LSIPRRKSVPPKPGFQDQGGLGGLGGTQGRQRRHGQLALKVPKWIDSAPLHEISSAGWPSKAPSLLLRSPRQRRRAKDKLKQARRQGKSWCMTHYAHKAPALGRDGALAMLAYWRYTVDGVNRRLSLLACISAVRQSQAPTPPFVNEGTPLF